MGLFAFLKNFVLEHLSRFLSFGAPFSVCPALPGPSWPLPGAHVSLTLWAVFTRRPGPRMPPPCLFSQTPLLARLAKQTHWPLYGEKPNRGSSGGAAMGGSRLPVAPSQARGDCRVTPSVCLARSRHPPGPEKATCPLRPPTHLSPAGLAPPSPGLPGALPTGRHWGLGLSRRWQMAGRLPTARSPQPCSGSLFTPHCLLLPPPRPG